MKRWIATALLSVLVLSGCASTAPRPTETVAADLQPFYDQQLSWTDCDSGFECTSVTAPLNWADPGQAVISLSLIRHRATGHSEGSLLVNPGGPGGSGVGFIRDSLDYAVSANLQQHFDIVGFDPRGVGSSTAVRCFDDAEMDSFLYDITPGARGSAEWLAASVAAQAEFNQSCANNTGELLQFVDTESAARDLDLLRAVLGDRALNYLGYSYGTFLGATYIELYPNTVGRMVLDGAVDPAASAQEVNIAQARGFESALRAYLSDCLAKANCPFAGETVDEAMRSIRALLDDYDAAPISASDGRQVGANTLLTAIIYPLYSPEGWSALSEMLSSAQKGRVEMALRFADLYNERDESGHYGSNQTVAFVAINCVDYPQTPNPPAADLEAQRAELEAAAPTIGTYFAYGALQCADWPAESVSDRTPAQTTSTQPIIVIGTTNDPATPYQWAVNLAGQLQNALLITYQGEGHTAYNKSNACVGTAVDDYFISGTLPPQPLTC